MYRALLIAKPGTLLRGGVKQVLSSWFKSKREAQDYVYAMDQPNLGKVKYQSAKGRDNPGKKPTDLTLKLLSGSENQLKRLLRRAGYAVGFLTNPGVGAGLDLYSLAYAPKLAEEVARGAQGLVRRSRKRKRKAMVARKRRR